MSKKLPVMEHFYTLQGEGAYSGIAAYFVRLAGCEVGCHWCDVKESWTISANQYMEIAEIVAVAKDSGAEIVVITGGEPTMHNLTEITEAFHLQGLRTHIETSGAYPFSGNFDWICLSPKKFLPPKPEYYAIAHELKIIIFNDSDFEWAEKHAALCNENCVLLLQSEWDKKAQMYPKMVAYIQQNPKWRMSVQTHKYLEIP